MGEIHRKKRKQIPLRLSDETYSLLEKKSKIARMNKTEFIESLIINGGVVEIRKFDPELLEKASYEINKIGVNINQIVYHVNAKGGGATSQDLESLLREFRKIEEMCITIFMDGLYAD